jgi:hypothetical protein
MIINSRRFRCTAALRQLKILELIPKANSAIKSFPNPKSYYFLVGASNPKVTEVKQNRVWQTCVTTLFWRAPTSEKLVYPSFHLNPIRPKALLLEKLIN